MANTSPEGVVFDSEERGDPFGSLLQQFIIRQGYFVPEIKEAPHQPQLKENYAVHVGGVFLQFLPSSK